jgi:hypothetical protein
MSNFARRLIFDGFLQSAARWRRRFALVKLHGVQAVAPASPAT